VGSRTATDLVYDPIAAASRSPWTRRLNMAQDAALVVVAALFAYGQTLAVLDGNSLNLGFAFEQAILVTLFLVRRRSRATSRRPFDWIVAAGGWLPLLARPAEIDGPWAVAGAIVQVGGLGFACAAILSLGRSFGVVAANRGLKVGGMYRFVRHPIYLAHVLTFTGFLMANPSLLNAALYVLTTTCHLLRIRAEERVLEATSDYAAYRQQVRWRLVPGLF
jgi:protein-S-isoprenylcysteine O-methyltransferase Ste14